MPKAKLKLTEADAAKVNTVHSLVGTTTADAFKAGKQIIATISARSAEQLVEFGRTIETVSDEDVKAFGERLAAAKKAEAEKAAKSSVKPVKK